MSTYANANASKHEAKETIKTLVKQAFATPGARVLVIGLIPEKDGLSTRVVSNANPGQIFIDAHEAVLAATNAWMVGTHPNGRRTPIADDEEATHA
jgi:hypothetical protein